MFFDVSTFARRADTLVRELPPTPETGWQPPAQWPELRGASIIGYDCETKETDFDHGPGWGRGEGHIIGVSLSSVWPDGQRGKWYFPLRHEIDRHYNIADTGRFFNYLREQLETPIPKTGANLLYDYGWLASEGIFPQGKQYDVQFAEALLDDEARTALDVLGLKYVHRGKFKDQCREWIGRAYPAANEKTWRGYLWRTSPALVGPYAEDDADLPIDVLWAQWPLLAKENLLDLFDLECRQIPLLVKMRLPGIPVDLAHTETIRAKLDAEIVELYAGLRHKTGTTIDNVTAASQLAKAFDAAGIAYPKTAAGNASFKKEWLKLLSDDPIRDPSGVGKLVNDIREREKLRGTFIDKYILGRAKTDAGSNSVGRIFCSFHPLRGEDGGAKTGRYSSSDPNLQNIPSRTKIGKLVRAAFIPEPGHVAIHKKDHSQIEYRVFAHFAVGQGADEMRARYVNDPKTDYHYDTMQGVAEVRRIILATMSDEAIDAFRKPIKNVNFGLLYGQTEKALAYKAGWTDAEAKEFFTGYHAARPFVRTTMAAIQSDVQYHGYITTVLGRRVRFTRWEAIRYADRDGRSYAEDDAIRLFGQNRRRAFAYKAVNYRFQGSAADVLKKGMVDCYESGVFDYTGMPKLTVHDELDWSKPTHDKAMNDAFAYITHVMETAIKLRVPLKVDSSEGANWGEAK